MLALTSSPTLAQSYVDVGFVHISWANLGVIGAMIVFFVLVLVLPFPSHHSRGDGTGE